MQMSELIILADTFVYTKNNKAIDVRATLSNGTLSVCYGNSSNAYRIKCIHVADIIGAKVHYGFKKETVYLVVHYLPLVKTRFNGKIRRCQKQAVFCANKHDTINDNVNQCTEWNRAISVLVNGVETKDDGSKRPKKRAYLIFVNPKGGQGSAKKMWLDSVKPMFDIAGIISEVVYTEYSGHAGDYVKDCEDLYKYYAIVTISGDGIIFEVFNGLMKREDCEDAIKVPLAIIPGGSGNGVCASILYQCGVPVTVMDAVFVAIRGITTPIDLMQIEQGDNIMWSCLSIQWGVISSIDIDSEKFRWMGEARFTLESVKKVLSHSSLKSGKVWFDPLPPQSNDSYDFPATSSKKVVNSFCKKDLSDPLRTESSASSGSASSTEPLHLDQPSSEVSERCKKIENIGLKDVIPDSWTMLEGALMSVNAFSLTHLTTTFQWSFRVYGLDSGFMWLMWSDVGSFNRKDFVNLLLQNVSPENNKTRTIHYEKVSSFRLEPDVTESGGYVTADGELVKYEPIHVCIHKGKARVICLPE